MKKVLGVLGALVASATLLGTTALAAGPSACVSASVSVSAAGQGTAQSADKCLP